MPPFLLPLLGVIALALGLFGKRGGAAILSNLAGHGEESSVTKTEIHNHYYQGSGPRAEEEGTRLSEAPEPRIRRRARREPPRVLDANPYDDEQEHEHVLQTTDEQELKP
jgi:hypothetical protein